MYHLQALEAVLVVWGVRLCWATRNVPDAVNESKVIASGIITIAFHPIFKGLITFSSHLAMTFVFMLVILVFPIIFLLGLEPVVNQIIASLSFAIGNIVAIGLLFGPKALIVVNGDDIDLNGKKVQKGRSGKIAATTVDIDPEAHETEPKFANVKEAFKAIKNLDQRARMCREQMTQWEKLLMQLEMRDSSNTNHSSSNVHTHSKHSKGEPGSVYEPEAHVADESGLTGNAHNQVRLYSQPNETLDEKN